MLGYVDIDVYFLVFLLSEFSEYSSLGEVLELNFLEGFCLFVFLKTKTPQ